MRARKGFDELGDFCVEVLDSMRPTTCWICAVPVVFVGKLLIPLGGLRSWMCLRCEVASVQLYDARFRRGQGQGDAEKTVIVSVL